MIEGMLRNKDEFNVDMYGSTNRTESETETAFWLVEILTRDESSRDSVKIHWKSFKLDPEKCEWPESRTKWS